MSLKDVTDKHYNSITKLMKEAGQAVKAEAVRSLDLGSLLQDPDGFKEVYKAKLIKKLVPYLKKATADGLKKAEEVTNAPS